MVNRSIKYQQISGVDSCGSKVEVCVVEVFLRGEPLVLVACYRSLGSDAMTVGEWQRFLAQFGGKKVLFVGDFNAHHVGWRSLRTCPVGVLRGSPKI